MGPITLSLGLACAVAAAFTLIGRDYRRDHDDGLVAVGLVYVWAICAMGIALSTELFPDVRPAPWVYQGPALDLIMGAYVVALHRQAPSRWKAWLVMICGLQLITHIAFGLGDKSFTSEVAYKFALNVSFVAQLLCAMAPGGSYGIRRLFRRLSSGPYSLRNRRHGARG